MNISSQRLTLAAFGGIALLFGFSQHATASVIDLGDAGDFSVLATDGSISSSDSAFQGGFIGVAAPGFSYTQSGGGETGLQESTTAFINTGSSFGDIPKNVTVSQSASSNAFLQQAVADATNASNTLAALAPTQTLGNISNGLTISENSVGTYVLSISSINLNQSAITLSAPAGSTFVLNVSGNITMNGGSQGNGILVAGGLTASNVIINMTGGGTVDTTGGGNAQDIQASILDLNGSVQLHPGEVDGHVIAQSFSSSSGALVNVPLTTVPEMNPGLAFAALLPLFLLATPRRMRSLYGYLRGIQA